MNNKRYLMTPGPTEIPLRVLKALVRQDVTQEDPEFVRTTDETSRLLQKVLETKNEVVFFPGSGRVGVEAAVTSIVEPGDRILTVNNGVFGKWMGLTVTGAGGENVELAFDPRRAVDPEQVRQILATSGDVKAVAVVHNETCTGIVNPVAEIGEIVEEHGVLYVVDTVSSAGGDFVKTDEWQIDLNCTGSYKCMNSTAGLAIVSVSDDAWELMAKRRVRRSFSFDLYKYMEMWIPRERGGSLIWGTREHVVGPVSHLTYALKEALQVLLEEGLVARCRRNALAGKAVRAAAKAMDLELWALDERDASNTVTAIVNPDGLDNTKIIGILREKFGIVVGGGVEETAGKLFRIAHMSITSQEMYILDTIQALEQTLLDLGWKLEPGAGVRAARTIFDGARSGT